MDEAADVPACKIPAESKKTTTEAASPGKQLNIEEFIMRHLALGRKQELTYSITELRQLLNKARETFRFQPTLLELTCPILIVGDIHGQYHDLRRIFRQHGKPDQQNYLFLGDYIDRGPNSIECICLLFAFKIFYNDYFFLLRGNHETAVTNRQYGFREDIERRFKSNSSAERNRLYQAFNSVFDMMPLAATINKRLLCMHGGVGPKLKSLADIAHLERPIEVLRGLSLDLLWADPLSGVSGFSTNELRGISLAFGEDIVKEVCNNLGIDMIVRGHQVVQHGYEFFADRRLVTIFSAPRYEHFSNDGAVMRVDANMRCTFHHVTPRKFNN